jgi:hypothetical protein
MTILERDPLRQRRGYNGQRSAPSLPGPQRPRRLYNERRLHHHRRVMPPRKGSTPAGTSERADDLPPPEIIVDFRFDHGLIYIALINISEVPAHRVRVKFNKVFHGLGGDCDMTALGLFRRVEFLAPRKCIETLLDSSHAYFKRGEPTVIKALVTFRDARGKAHRHEIVHDLKIYKEISYVVNREPAVSPQISERPANPRTTSATPVKDPDYGNPKRQSLLQFQLPR